MMTSRIVKGQVTTGEVLEILNEINEPKVIFIVDDSMKLIGSISDGDIRRYLIGNSTLDDSIMTISNKNPYAIQYNKQITRNVFEAKRKGFKVIPILNSSKQVIDIIDLTKDKSIIPVTVFLMAGGMGIRLRPLTLKTPKPLLTIKGKPIIDHIFEHLQQYKFSKYFISINYLGEQIENHFIKRKDTHFLKERERMGTIGSLSLAPPIDDNFLLLLNADAINDVNFEELYLHGLENNADIVIVTKEYENKIPYAVVSIEDNIIKRIDEKPLIHYYINTGIYLIKSELIQFIPRDKFLDAPDFIQNMMALGKKVVSFKHRGLWHDVGRLSEYHQMNSQND